MQQHLNGTIIVAEDHGRAGGRQLVRDSLPNADMKVLIIEHPPYEQTIALNYGELPAQQIENPDECATMFAHAPTASESEIKLQQLVLEALEHGKKVFAADILAYNGFDTMEQSKLVKRDEAAARAIKRVIAEEGRAGVVILWGRNHFYPKPEWELDGHLLCAKLRTATNDGPAVPFHLIDGLEL